MSPFRCLVVHEGATARVRPVGLLDMSTTPILAAELEHLRAAGCRSLIVDLRDLDFMDTSGLHLLLECDAEARKDGFSIALIAGPPAVQLMFEVTDTTTRLRFVDP